MSLVEETEKDEWSITTSHSLRVKVGAYELWSRKGTQTFPNEAYMKNALQDARALAAFLEQARTVTEGWKHPEKLAKAISVEPILPKNTWEGITLTK